MTCTVDDCTSRGLARQLCNRHYKRLIRYGSPTAKPEHAKYHDLSDVDRSLYNVWNSMRGRCYNPHVKSYASYGARGIWVCAGWRGSYRTFRENMGARPTEAHSLDRIDNDGGYTCGKCSECIARGWLSNVQWATRQQQADNSTTVRYLEHEGRRLTIAQWTRERRLGKGTISDRLERGWSIADAIDTPLERAWRYLRTREAA